jgi:hypothetical protein
MVREVFCMAIALWAVMWAWDARAEAPPCWRKGDASTHPLFFNDVRNLPKSFDDRGKLRIAFIWDHRRRNRDPSTWVAGLQEAIDLVGVDIEVEVACSSAWTDVPNTPTGAYYYVRDRHAQDIGERNRADLVAVMSVGTGDGYCGVASLGRKDRAYIRTSATSCGLDTFIHEIGHNFGLHHAHKDGYEGRKGWCMSPADNAKNCWKGTVMSYASGSSRIRRFADVDAGWGTEEHTAAAYLRESIPMQAKAWEIRTGFIGPDPEDRVGSVICPVASQQDSGLPSLPAERSPLIPTTPVHSH